VDAGSNNFLSERAADGTVPDRVGDGNRCEVGRGIVSSGCDAGLDRQLAY